MPKTRMDATFQAILDSLPPKPARSKLEPYAELIHELRKRGRSYREIAGILKDRCGVVAGTHTVYNFVRVRAAAPDKRKPVKAAAAERLASAANPTASGTGQEDDVRKRIQALKERPVTARAGAEKVFHYDENVPLTRTPAKKDDV